MARQSRKYLFSDGDLDGTVRAHFAKINERVSKIPEQDLVAADDEALADEIFEEYQIVPISLDEGGISMHREEIKVDVSGDRSRYFSRSAGPHYVPGIRVEISVPFCGDAILWKLRPSQWSSVVPFGTINADHGGRDGTLVVAIEYPSDQSAAEAKKLFDSNMKDIRFYLESQNSQISRLNTQLPASIGQAIRSRKSTLRTQHDGLEEAFGIPVKKSAKPRPAVVAKPTHRRKGKMSNGSPVQKWDVFLSHASEDKDDFARPLANALMEVGLSVWFDEFTIKVGDSLRRSIDKGLANAEFGIVLVSPAFLNKEWPQKELDALMGRESNGVKVILPVWHDVTADYVQRFSPMLADRLASSSTTGIDQVVSDLLQVIRPG